MRADRGSGGGLRAHKPGISGGSDRSRRPAPDTRVGAHASAADAKRLGHRRAIIKKEQQNAEQAAGDGAGIFKDPYMDSVYGQVRHARVHKNRGK